MSPKKSALHRRAVSRLFIATIIWGVSFPLMRSVGLLQPGLLPGGDTWFLGSASTLVRFGLAGLILAVISLRDLSRLTWLEIYQGGGLGLGGGLGILFQMDGLAYTPASTSAFLTQSYCLLLPLVVALRDRRWPSGRVWLSGLLVFAGIAILGRVRFDHFQLGRGEIETLVGSLLFTGQILWLERPIFKNNDVRRFSVVMFLGTTLVCWPVTMLHSHPGDWAVTLGSGRFWLFTGILIFPCTLVSYLMMNKWQPFVPATEAGLIYCAEPVWASFFALFIPGIITRCTGLHYQNETATVLLLLGGGLITGANILIQTGNSAPKATPQDAKSAG